MAHRSRGLFHRRNESVSRWSPVSVFTECLQKDRHFRTLIFVRFGEVFDRRFVQSGFATDLISLNRLKPQWNSSSRRWAQSRGDPLTDRSILCSNGRSSFVKWRCVHFSHRRNHTNFTIDDARTHMCQPRPRCPVLSCRTERKRPMLCGAVCIWLFQNGCSTIVTMLPLIGCRSPSFPPSTSPFFWRTLGPFFHTQKWQTENTHS